MWHITTIIGHTRSTKTNVIWIFAVGALYEQNLLLFMFYLLEDLIREKGKMKPVKNIENVLNIRN